MTTTTIRKGGTCKANKKVSGVTLVCVLPKHAQKKHNNGKVDWWEVNTRDKGKGSVFPLSDGRWAAEIVIDGNKVRRSAKTEGLADEKLVNMQRMVREGQAIQSKSQTLATWMTFWVENLAKHKPKTAETTRSLVNKHIIPTIGSVRLDALAPQHVRKLETAILDGGLLPSTALRAHSVLDTAIDAAWREGLITENIVKRAVRPRKGTSAVAIVTPDDAVKVMQNISSERLLSRIAAAFFTAARQGELLGLELSRVDLLRSTIDLSWQLQALSWQHGCGDTCGRKRGTDCPQKKLDAPADWEHQHLTGTLYLARPKSDAGKRVIPLEEPLRTILERRIATSMTEPNPFGLVWTSDPKKDRHGRPQPLDGSPIMPSTDSKAWHDALTRAGIPAAPLHAARHTTASLLNRCKVPETIITRILGHSSYLTSIGYMDIDEEQTREALAAISAFMPLELEQIKE